MASYDYIIVGGGAAGAVVASRLTEDPTISVLLLEAGKRTHRHPFVRMPIAFPQMFLKEKFGRHYESEPEPALDGRPLHSFRGRALGGSTTINGMMYTRGNRVDYDRWHASGLPGWSYAEILPYFKRLEKSWRGVGAYHGDSGPIAVTEVRDPIMLYDDFEASARATGHEPSPDLYGEKTTGVGRIELTVGRGERSGTANSYLSAARLRKNLTIATGALTTRVVVEKGRAIGVEYEQDGYHHRVNAEAEVVLSGGTFCSPQLLMLSGIGPTNELEAFGIDTLVDLPGVGRNLQEHPMVGLVWKAKRRKTFLTHLRWDQAALRTLQWAVFKQGPFATTACYGVVYAKTVPNLERPDIQIAATAVGLDAKPWFPFLTAPALHRFVSIVSLMHASSRGWVKLRSRDPRDKPRISYNMMQHRNDMETMIRGIQAARAIYTCGPQSDLIASEAEPGSDLRSDDELEGYIRRVVRPAEHPTGTCSMGVGNEAVVDAELRVRGIAGLRVIDASVMPDEPGGNTVIPTIMVAEKGADLLCGRHSCS